MNPIRPQNRYQFTLTCLRCQYQTNSYSDLRLHYTHWKCQPFEVLCQCCAGLFYTKVDLAAHLNQPNVYGRLPLAGDSSLASGVLPFGPSAMVSAPSHSGSAALGHAVRPPPSPISAVYHSSPPRLSSPVSPLSLTRSPLSPPYRVRLVSSATSSSSAVYLITSPSSLASPVHSSVLVSGSLDPLLSSSAPVGPSVLPPPQTPVSSSAVVSEGAFEPLTSEELDSFHQYFDSVPDWAVAGQPYTQADASPLPAVPLTATSSSPIITVASSPSVASSPLSSDHSAPSSRRPRDRDRDRDRSRSGSRTRPRGRVTTSSFGLSSTAPAPSRVVTASLTTTAAPSLPPAYTAVPGQPAPPVCPPTPSAFALWLALSVLHREGLATAAQERLYLAHDRAMRTFLATHPSGFEGADTTPFPQLVQHLTPILQYFDFCSPCPPLPPPSQSPSSSS